MLPLAARDIISAPLSIEPRLRVHFIGIGGRAMGGIAVALARAGHSVSGSDRAMYDPMRSFLEREGIAVSAFDPQAVPMDADAIVVGRRVRDDNPELQWVRRHGLRHHSFPAFLHDQFLNRSRNAVVAGGVGKTTTTAMLAWVLQHAGATPDYLIGGIAHNFPLPARFAGAAISVLEGDEYASGPDDASPKFLHYAPEVVAITNLLLDHPDLYADRQNLVSAFVGLVRALPASGLLVLPSEGEAVDDLAAAAPCAVVRVGTNAGANLRIESHGPAPDGMRFTLDGVRFRLSMFGDMNVRNAAMAAAAASHFGIGLRQSSLALESFRGLPDRQEVIEVGAVTVVRDKASHPRSMTALCQALRQRFPGRRLVLMMQPRATGGRRWIYQQELPAALAEFDVVVLTAPYEHTPAAGVPWEQEPFSLELLAGDLQTLGTPVVIAPALRDAPAVLLDVTRSGDVVLLSLREQFAADLDVIAGALAGQFTLV
jgi:UDP-N-acetylmuramate: L-alanyl-gamma-D-glutamyl-meso-diaminopimelate ligase